MRKYDIVYVLKNDVKPDELKYSLRSLKNFPHKKIWFFGGKPEGIEPDEYVEVIQEGISKYTKARSTWKTILDTDELTDNFWLFNDDFYVMKEITKYEPVYDETLFEKIIRVEDKYMDRTNYTRHLRNAAAWLRENGYDVKNYELHMPMLINKEKMKAILPESDLPIHSIYGNIYNVGKVNRHDVKIVDLNIEPDPDCDFLSTSDISFRKGKVGEFIKKQFTEPCEYEVMRDEETDK